VWSIIGLGNPGRQYEGTRHNVGFDVIDLLSERWRIPVNKKNPIFLFGSGDYQSIPVLLAKPMQYMNRSGETYRRLLREPEVTCDQTIIVLDDLHLPVGKVRIRPQGGNGGHNGLRSVLQAAGTNAVPRLKIGIDGTEKDWEEFVLKPFRRQERELIDEALVVSAEAIELALLEGIETAMNRFN
jgi:PTH1 family peptidyl-tRNA hydrolase